MATLYGTIVSVHRVTNSLYNNLSALLGKLRAFFWHFFLKKIGKNVLVMSGVKIMSPQKVALGHDVYIHYNVILGGQNGITIGNFVNIGYNVTLATVNLSYKNPSVPIIKQGYYGSPIKIEDDVWIGAKAVILSGVKIGRGAIVGANAVVTKEVKPYTIVGGIPAKVIKNRFNKKELAKAYKLDLS